ncbi:MAG TPA: hypothetical protein VL282_04105, partial [Tepidisphaeraceae bacterium]|nr:hypothetical protein [Tepidisphaeraceae bacterium]
MATTLTARPTFLRSIIEHNPFYLLSAACMLGGCLALTNSLSWSPIHRETLLKLMAALNVYEFLLVGLAYFLIRKRNVRSDAIKLLVLEALFIVDVAFLNSEIFAQDFYIGLMVNLIVFMLMFCKLAIIFRALKIPILSEPFFLVLFEMTLLIATPGAFKWISDHRNGKLPELAVYAAWWGIAAIPVVYVWLMHWRPVKLSSFADALVSNKIVLAALIILPLASLIAHVSTANWVYKARWFPTNVAPLLLGLAIAFGTYDRHVVNLTFRLRAQILLPIAAIILSLGTPPQLEFGVAGIALTPLRLVFATATLIYVQGFWFHRHPYFAFAACTCIVLGGLGATWSMIVSNLGLLVGKSKET